MFFDGQVGWVVHIGVQQITDVFLVDFHVRNGDFVDGVDVGVAVFSGLSSFVDAVKQIMKNAGD